MKLTYTNVNGYLIPNLTYKSGEQMEQLGNAATRDADEQWNAAARRFVEMSVRCREYRKVLRILWPAKTILSDDRQSGQNCSLCL